MILRSLSDLVNDDVALVRRGRYLSTSFIVGIGEDASAILAGLIDAG